MPYDGLGTFNIGVEGYPFAKDSVAQSAKVNAVLEDLAEGLSRSICSDGQTTILQDISFNVKRITSLANAQSTFDAANVMTVVTNFGKWAGTATGTANAIVLSPSPAVAILTAGREFWFISALANTGAVTVSFTGLGGVKAITKGANAALAANDILANQLVGIIYDGVQFRLIGL